MLTDCPARLQLPQCQLDQKFACVARNPGLLAIVPIDWSWASACDAIDTYDTSSSGTRGTINSAWSQSTGDGTEVSPVLSDASGGSRSSFHSGAPRIGPLSDDGTMTTFDSGGTVLVLELACGVDSVIQVACQEFGLSFIGIHAGLELTATQRQVYKMLREFSERSSGSSGSRKRQLKLI